MKTCSVCNITAPTDTFPKRSAMCKICHNAYNKEHYQSNKQYYIDKARRWREDNPARNLATKYGCSEEEIQGLLDIGECQICGSTEKLHIDHCHQSGSVRGILCASCNIGLGHFNDSVDKLELAAKYLRSIG